MKIRTKKYRYLVSYNCINKLGEKVFGNSKMTYNKKININNISQLEDMFREDYMDKTVCINNIVLL